MSTEILAHWEIVRAKNAGQKPNPHGGQFDKWYLSLHNLDGGQDCDDAYWQRKAPSEVKVGDKVFGKVKDGDYGDRFYLEKEEGYEASTGSSGGSQNVSKGQGSGRDIDASIARQVALKILAPTINQKGLSSGVKTTVNEVERFILEAGQKASSEPPLDFTGARTVEPGQGSNQRQSPSTFPSDSDSPAASGSIPADDTQQWIENLLVVAGCPSHSSGLLATYAVSKLKPEQLKTLESELNDPESDRKTAGLKRLERSFEHTEAIPVPAAPDYDDSVPF